MSLSYQVSGALHRAFLVCGPSGVMRLVSLPTNTNKWDTARVVRSLCELYDDGFIGLAQILSDDFYRPVDVLASPDSTGQAFRCMVFSEPLMTKRFCVSNDVQVSLEPGARVGMRGNITTIRGLGVPEVSITRTSANEPKNEYAASRNTTTSRGSKRSGPKLMRQNSQPYKRSCNIQGAKRGGQRHTDVKPTTTSSHTSLPQGRADAKRQQEIMVARKHSHPEAVAASFLSYLENRAKEQTSREPAEITPFDTARDGDVRQISMESSALDHAVKPKEPTQTSTIKAEKLQGTVDSQVITTAMRPELAEVPVQTLIRVEKDL